MAHPDPYARLPAYGLGQQPFQVGLVEHGRRGPSGHRRDLRGAIQPQQRRPARVAPQVTVHDLGLRRQVVHDAGVLQDTGGLVVEVHGTRPPVRGGLPLKHLHLPAPAAEQKRDQQANRAGADDGHVRPSGRGSGGHRRLPRATSSATSMAAASRTARNSQRDPGRRARKIPAVMTAATPIIAPAAPQPGRPGPKDSIAVAASSRTTVAATLRDRPSMCGRPRTPAARPSPRSGTTFTRCALQPSSDAAASAHHGGHEAAGPPSVTKATSSGNATAYGTKDTTVAFSRAL